MQSADFFIQDDRPSYWPIITPLTAAGEQFAEDWLASCQKWGEAYLIDHKYFPIILDLIERQGLTFSF